MVDPGIALLTAGLIMFVGFLLFWPQTGMFSRWQAYQRIKTRVLREDALKHIETAQLEGEAVTMNSIAGALQINLDRAVDLLTELEDSQLVTSHENNIQLTPTGQAAALHILRAHRLYERYLADQTGYAEKEWHSLAEVREHNLTPDEVEALAARLGNPSHDPHGDPIPTTSGEAVSHEGKPITELEKDQIARITHIEDEPDTVAAQIQAEGLVPGMTVRLIEMTDNRVRFWAGGEEHILAPIFAAAISVLPIKKERAAPQLQGEPLSALSLGQKGEVIQVSPRVRGAERRRLMDLGILPGTEITAEMTSPGGDPTAYRIRGAMIALRKEQADLIRIQSIMEAN